MRWRRRATRGPTASSRRLLRASTDASCIDVLCCAAQQLAEAVHAKQAPHEHALAEERKKKNYREFWAVISLKDPFRLVLSEMRDRLFHTREILHHCLVHPKCALPPS